jgi:hypothetical protein
MFRSPTPRPRRVGLYYMLSISLTLLLLAASSIPTSAQPTGLGDQSDTFLQRSPTASNFDKTATARARRAGDRDRNVRIQPTVAVMSEGAEEIFGPDSGELSSEEDSSLEKACAEVNVRNFIVRARVFNPTGGGREWDYGITFREDADGNSYRFIISYASRWFVAVFDQAATSFSNAGTGSVPNMDLRRGGFNDIVLTVQDDLTIISVNGEFLTPVKTVEIINEGEICMSTDNINTWESDGRSFVYENFTIEELP